MLAEENKSSGRSPLDGKFTYFALRIIYIYRVHQKESSDSERLYFFKKWTKKLAVNLKIHGQI